MFASHLGVTLEIDELCIDRRRHQRDNGHDLTPDDIARAENGRAMGVLFNEELGALIQICRADREQVTPILRACGVPYHFVGHMNEWDEIRIIRNAKKLLREKRVDLQRAWSETSYQMQTLRDNPSCAQQEFDRILDTSDPGLSPQIGFDAQDEIGRASCRERVSSPV